MTALDNFFTNSLPSAQTLYIAISAIIAVGIWVQITLLRRNQGKMPQSSLFHLLSLADTIWVLVSAAALYFLDFNKLAIAVPAVYGIYTFLGFFYAARTITNDNIPDNPEDIVFDNRYLNFCQSFALVFFGLCLVALLSIKNPQLIAFL